MCVHTKNSSKPYSAMTHLSAKFRGGGNYGVLGHIMNRMRCLPELKKFSNLNISGTFIITCRWCKVSIVYLRANRSRLHSWSTLVEKYRVFHKTKVNGFHFSWKILASICRFFCWNSTMFSTGLITMFYSIIYQEGS